MAAGIPSTDDEAAGSSGDSETPVAVEGTDALDPQKEPVKRPKRKKRKRAAEREVTVSSEGAPPPSASRTPATAGAPSEAAEPEIERSRVATLGIGAAWLLGLAAAIQLIGAVLGSATLAESILGALVVDLAVGRAGVAWVIEGTLRALVIRRTVAAAAVAGAVALAIVILSMSVGWARHYPGRLDLSFLLSVVSIVAIAIRDELLYRAIPIHFGTKVKLPRAAIIGFAALLSPTSFLLANAHMDAVVLSIASGLLFAMAYSELGGIPGAVAAHATWSLALGPITRGGVTDLFWERGEIAEGTRASGTPAYVAAALSVAVAVIVVPVVGRKLARPQTR